MENGLARKGQSPVLFLLNRAFTLGKMYILVPKPSTFVPSRDTFPCVLSTGRVGSYLDLKYWNGRCEAKVKKPDDAGVS